MIPFVRSYRTQDGARDRLVGRMHELGRAHAEAVPRHDREGTLHLALLEALRGEGYLGASVPRRFGGAGHRLVDLVQSQAALAEHDASTALGVGMHLMVVGDEAEGATWPEWLRRPFLRTVAEGGVLLNVLATEPGIGSPQGDAPPRTALVRASSGRWSLSGTKSFATFAPVLTHAVVYCSIDDGSGRVARVLVPMSAPGVAIEETWDAIGMRATASHHVHFEDVALTDADILTAQPFTNRTRRPAMTPWFTLLVSAVYLGIARSAHAEATRHVLRTHEARTAATERESRRNLAACERRLLVAEAVLLSAAATVDGGARSSTGLSPLELAAKLEVTAAAIEVVDTAMRIVGGAALRSGSRLERAWRDVRCGTVHPPTDATALHMLEETVCRSSSIASLVANA